MLAVIFRRHLAEGVPYADYIDAWRAEKGYGVKARVLNATSLEDEREVLTIGFVGVSTRAMRLAQRFLAHHDESRHDRIQDVIDAPALVVRSEVIAEHHVALGEPVRPVRVGSRGSMLHLAHAERSDEPPDEASWVVLARSQGLREKADRGTIETLRTPPSDADRSAILVDARGVDDHDQLVSVLFVKGTTTVPEWSREWIDSGLDRLATDTGWRGEFQLHDEHDFHKDPIEVPLGSSQSILGR